MDRDRIGISKQELFSMLEVGFLKWIFNITGFSQDYVSRKSEALSADWLPHFNPVILQPLTGHFGI